MLWWNGASIIWRSIKYSRTDSRVKMCGFSDVSGWPRNVGKCSHVDEAACPGTLYRVFTATKAPRLATHHIAVECDQEIFSLEKFVIVLRPWRRSPLAARPSAFSTDSSTISSFWQRCREANVYEGKVASVFSPHWALAHLPIALGLYLGSWVSFS